MANFVAKGVKGLTVTRSNKLSMNTSSSMRLLTTSLSSETLTRIVRAFREMGL